jgi:hypothetical protein
VVSRVASVPHLTLGALGAAELAVVGTVAAEHGTDGVVPLVAALLLGPLGVVATAVVARRIAGARFATAAAAVFVVLPVVASRFMLGSYRSTYDGSAIPALVGVRHTVIFALGIMLAVVVAFAPRAVAAGGGAVAVIVAIAVWHLDGVGALRPALHETVWSISMLEWLLVAGILGALLRAPGLAVGVGGWLVAVILWSAHRGYDGGMFWESLAAAAPAVAVVLSSVALLVPTLRPDRRPARAPSAH